MFLFCENEEYHHECHVCAPRVVDVGSSFLHSIRVLREVPHEAGARNVQWKGDLVLPGAHEVVAVLAIIPGSAPGIREDVSLRPRNVLPTNISIPRLRPVFYDVSPVVSETRAGKMCRQFYGSEKGHLTS
jgi:hypothetical protein